MDQIRETYIVDAKGRKKAVILPIRKYRELLEDLHDLTVVAQRRDEKKISAKEMERYLKKRGLL